ncbi:MAG: hypothetical protein FH748_16645 [Balneolaceae bacterium]|nr:hypothetical protein [Balneolaceae bacterium]
MSLPLGISLSFLITSPLVNEVAIAIFWATCGWKITLIYVSTGVVLGVVGGILLEKIGMGKYIADWVKELEYKEMEVENSSKGFLQRLPSINREVSTTVVKLIPYVFAGMAVGAFIHGYVPKEFFTEYMAENNLLATFLCFNGHSTLPGCSERTARY